MNLRGLMQLGVLGERVGVDLWSFETKDGRSIRHAVEFLYPFSVGEKWKYQQIEGFQPEIFFTVMRMAAVHYSDEKFKTMLAKIPALEPSAKDFVFYSVNN